jgi:hypothetical protein
LRSSSHTRLLRKYYAWCSSEPCRSWSARPGVGGAPRAVAGRSPEVVTTEHSAFRAVQFCGHAGSRPGRSHRCILIRRHEHNANGPLEFAEPTASSMRRIIAVRTTAETQARGRHVNCRKRASCCSRFTRRVPHCWNARGHRWHFLGRPRHNDGTRTER